MDIQGRSATACSATASMRGLSGVFFSFCGIALQCHFALMLPAYRSASGPGVQPLSNPVTARVRLALARPACSPAPPNRIGSHMPVGHESLLLWSRSLALVRESSLDILLCNRRDRPCNHRAGPSSSVFGLLIR